jgi:hypothetical protein
MHAYRPPGAPTPPPPLPPQPNSYLAPTPATQQPPTPQPPPQAAETQHPHVRGKDHPHPALLAAWRRHHADTWVRADDLHQEVRQLIDPRGTHHVVRQKLRMLLRSCHQLEAERRGNAARPVTYYRVTGSEAAGLGG